MIKQIHIQTNRMRYHEVPYGSQESQIRRWRQRHTHTVVCNFDDREGQRTFIRTTRGPDCDRTLSPVGYCPYKCSSQNLTNDSWDKVAGVRPSRRFEGLDVNSLHNDFGHFWSNNFVPIGGDCQKMCAIIPVCKIPWSGQTGHPPFWKSPFKTGINTFTFTHCRTQLSTTMFAGWWPRPLGF